MHLTSILVVTDFSIGGNHTIERAAQLAIAHSATLRLLYAPSTASPMCDNPARRLARVARALSRRPGLVVRAIRDPATSLRNVVRQSLAADLLVIHDRQERNLQTLLLGQPVIRLARLCDCPVLVTRNTGYARSERVLVAVDFSARSRQLAALACALEKDSRIELFHAVSTSGEGNLRQADVPHHVIKTYRETCVEHAQKQLALLRSSFGMHPVVLDSSIGRGDPAEQAVARQRAINADLLVVGMSRGGMVRDLFFGSPAQRVLRRANCDVLFVPHAEEPLSTTAARRRIDVQPRASALDYNNGGVS